MSIDLSTTRLAQVRHELGRVIVGQDRVVDRLLVAVLADGHVLLEGAPGLGKTMLLATLARILGGTFNRIQFTPDLIPSDIVGTRIFRPSSESFTVEPGPILANVVLVDEINRAPARVQSALLEAMRAALVPPRRSQWQVLLVAAALLGLMLAGAAAVGAFRSQPVDQLTDVPSSSPPALGDVVSPEPSRSVDPSASPSDGGGSAFGAPLPRDSIAEVVSGRLRIRSQPRVADDSIKYEPLLGVGARLMILDGPVTANDYDWYQVAAWDPKDPQATFPAGWVARGDHDGTPWISETADVCPTGEVTIADVVGLAPAERVACFGHRELRLRAFVTDGSESYAWPGRGPRSS